MANLSMAVFILFYIVANYSSADAPSIEELSPQVIYQDTDVIHANLFPLKIDNFFLQEDFTSLELPGIINSDILTPWLNRIYFSKTINTFVFAKTHILISGPVVFGKLYSAGKGYIIHYRITKLGDFSFFIKNLPRQRAVDFTAKLTDYFSNMKIKTISRTSLYWQLLSPSSRACDPSDPSSELTNNTLLFLKTKSECANRMIKAGQEVTGSNALVKLAYSAYPYVAHPLDTFKNDIKAIYNFPSYIHNKIGEEIGTLSKLTGNFDNFVEGLGDSFGEFKQEFKTQWSQVPFKVKMDLLCETTSIIGNSLISVPLTKGRTTAGTLNALALAFKRVNSAAGNTATKKLVEYAARLSKLQKARALGTILPARTALETALKSIKAGATRNTISYQMGIAMKALREMENSVEDLGKSLPKNARGQSAISAYIEHLNYLVINGSPTSQIKLEEPIVKAVSRDIKKILTLVNDNNSVEYMAADRYTHQVGPVIID